MEGSQILPDVSISGKREFTIIWGARFEEPARNGYGIRARQYHKSGRPFGGEWLVTTEHEEDGRTEADGAIACTLDGACAVAWESEGSDDSTVWARGIHASGASLSPSFEVSVRQNVMNYVPSVARTFDGVVMVVWQDAGPALQTPPVVAMGRLYEPNGSPRTPPFPLGTISTNSRQPQVVADARGGFVVAWWARGPDVEADFDIFVRRFNVDGSSPDNEFRVNEYTPGIQARPAIAAADDGGFLVVWEGGPDEESAGVYARRVEANDIPSQPTHHVNTYVLDSQVVPAAENDGVGGFFVAWVSLSSITGPGQDGDGPGVFGRRLHDDGSPDGLEFQINTTTEFAQGWLTWPIGLAARNGHVIATWQDERKDSNNEGIFAQRFTVTPGTGPLCGDAYAQDLRLDLRDAVSVLQASAGLRPCLSCLCDADGSGTVATADALIVLGRVVGVELPPQCPACNDGDESPAGAFGFGFPE